MAPNYRIEMTTSMGTLDKASPCRICCGHNTFLNIRHVHFSTTYYNKQMAHMGNMTPMCHFCLYPHPIDNRTRQNVILSTSTLSGVPFLEGWGWGDETPLHCDMETVPGAKIVNLKRVWERAYRDNPLPLDTVLVAGLNDIKDLVMAYRGRYDGPQLAELVADSVMLSIKSLHRVIKAHSQEREVEDTLAVATILHTPAMYWKEGDGDYPTRDYYNMKEMIDRTNLEIEAFNLSNGRPKAPKIHQAGERAKKGKRMYMWEAWREEAKQDKLHLKDKHRFRVTKNLVVKYFRTDGTPTSHQIQD
jgi:hypothetical protein